MKDLNRIIDGLGRSGVLSGLAGGVTGGALTGMLTSKRGRKIGKKALKDGALAAVGGLAWTAYQRYRAGTPGPAAAPAGFSNLSRDRFDVIADQRRDTTGPLLLIRAMIAAAHADGHIDAGERQRIFERVDALPLSGEDKAMLFDELRNPLDLDALVRLVPDGETAVEVYASSLLAVDASQRQAAWYLAELARRLAIPQQLVDAVHQEAGSVQPGGSLHSAA